MENNPLSLSPPPLTQELPARVSPKNETHCQRIARIHPPQPCTASHMTFNGRCLNCGWGPSSPSPANPPLTQKLKRYRIIYRSGPDRSVRKTVDQSFASDTDLQKFEAGMVSGGATIIDVVDLALPVIKWTRKNGLWSQLMAADRSETINPKSTHGKLLQIQSAPTAY